MGDRCETFGSQRLSSFQLKLLQLPAFPPVLSSLLEMTLLSSQSSSPVAPSGSVSTENPEQRMLEKRTKVIEELLQTERDYIRDLEMCIERIMIPLQQAQVGTGEEVSFAFNMVLHA